MDLKRFYSLNFLGRLLLSAIFINAIPGKITNFAAQAEYITSRGFPEPVSMIMMAGAIAVSSAYNMIYNIDECKSTAEEKDEKLKDLENTNLETTE